MEDVTRIDNHSLDSGDAAIYGYICDAKSGKLIEAPAPTLAGQSV